MIEGYIKVATAVPKIKVADPLYNGQQVRLLMDQAKAEHIKIMVFPELVLSGYTCSDLFLQKSLIDGCYRELLKLIDYSQDMDCLFAIGLPFAHMGKLYNVAAMVFRGYLLGLVTKTHMPNYNEFYELRHFTPGPKKPIYIDTDLANKGFHRMVPLGSNILFYEENTPELVVGAEICEDVWTPMPPSISHAMAGATVILNTSASNEAVGKASYRRELIKSQSAKLVAGYIYTNAGEGESTTDIVFGGHSIIAENGAIVAESKRYATGINVAELDIEKLTAERRRMSSFSINTVDASYEHVPFTYEAPCYVQELTRQIPKYPFVPSSEYEKEERCEEILAIQAMGLKKRLEHTNCKCAVVGISGGLDSTLALLVMARAFDAVKLPRENMIAVTMPCFGTTNRTYQNACELTKQLGATLLEVDIKEAVRIHFRDIGQDENVHDVTYENGQARERTQILMDIANKNNGMVIGTGDMSELALGWATYNGDHMSMYGVNVSVPKTLVRHLVKYSADIADNDTLREVLFDILDTPVSPELLPPKEGEISQKTEDLVGPYELHDFFLYYVLRFGFTPKKILALANAAFGQQYDRAFILKWMRTFYWRFFAQQFKRSCLPDGPKVGSVAVSPRGDLRMPSDASSKLWLDEIANLES